MDVSHVGRYVISVTPRSVVRAAMLVSLSGCTQAIQSNSAAPGATPATTNAPYTTLSSAITRVRNTAGRLFETQTVSLALDRIDQHTLPLDHTYRRQGTGAGVTVYVFDGGVLAGHPELSGRVRKGYDAFPTDPAVCNAHGTAVAGAIAGKTLGVAPAAQIVDVKMVECARLRGTVKAITDGVQWVLEDHKKNGGPAIANWSFIADTSQRIPALDSAVKQLHDAGIPVVVSAGNFEISACRVSPGNAEGTIVVGASAVMRYQGDDKPYDYRAANTAFGPCIDVYAPGDSVLLPSFDGMQSPSVQLWNGTSMSAGYVSGAVALFLEGHPRATPDQARQYLRSNATLNSVRDAESQMTWLLYVGPRREEMMSVAEIRALQRNR